MKLSEYPKNVPSIPRMYDAALRGDWTAQELVAIAFAPKHVQNLFVTVCNSVWHPTSEQLAAYRAGTLTGDDQMDVRWHLDVDKCPTCK
jgi:hypothetical protein